MSAVRDYERNPVGYRLRFMTRRLLRIFPLYLLTSLVFLFLLNPGMLTLPFKSLAYHLMAHALFLHNLDFSTFGSLNGVSWSLALEMQFYVAMAFAAPLLRRAGAGLSLFALVAIAIAYRYGTTLVLPPGTSSPMDQMMAACQLPGTLDAFGFGIAIALAKLQSGPLAKRLLSPSWTSFGLWSALTCILLPLTFAYFWPRAGYWSALEMIVLWRTALAASFGCLLATVITFPWGGHTALAPLRYLGTISYGIYLWHPMVINGLHGAGMGGYRLLRWTLIAACGLAAFTWHWLEKPATQRTKH